MPFNTKEQEIIKYGLQNGKSRQEVEQAIQNLRLGIKTEKAKPEETLGSKLLERGKTIVSEVTGKPLRETLETARMDDGKDVVLTGAEALTRTAEAPLRVAGAAGGAIGDVIGAGMEATGISDAIGTALKPVVEANKETIMKAIDAFHALPKDTQEVSGAILDSLNLLLGGLAKKGVVAGTEKATKVVGETVSKAGKVLEKPLSVAKGMGDDISRIPSRIATNVAEKQAVKAKIAELPTQTAKTGAMDGIDVPDVKFIYQVPKENKPIMKELADTVKKFSLGETKTNPIEIVGKPIVQRIKELNSAKGTIGQKLGEVANNLGVVTKEELFNPVFNSIKSVSGLNGLTIKNGVLNFKNTVLATTENSSARKTIQNLFNQATKWGNGKNKHLLRQELFETLGGKKKALTAMTDTEEKAINAIRKGLSDVLEGKNAQYKTLSNEYRKIIQPINDIRKMMKNIDPTSTEDILDMSAGLLARRLTSNAVSNPQIRQILKAMDEAVTGMKGTAKVSVENLQDFYNILDKYYDIAGKTGFQSQVKAGVEKAGGVSEAIVGKAREIAGQTVAVRQKALEDMLKEIFGN